MNQIRQPVDYANECFSRNLPLTHNRVINSHVNIPHVFTSFLFSPNWQNTKADKIKR